MRGGFSPDCGMRIAGARVHHARMSSRFFARTPSSPLMPSRPPVPVSSSQRASLDGLEVRDSSWDEWVAAEALLREQQQQQRAAAQLQAPRR